MWDGFEAGFWTIIAYLATLGTIIRFYSHLKSRCYDQAPDTAAADLVSIIVPARNESSNLRKLLPSLLASTYPPFEIIVVDDHSYDDTAVVATRFKVKVIKARVTPSGWTGKNWACFEGALEARGKILLFTDADTFHEPDGLQRSIALMKHFKVDMLSAPPRHRAEFWWDKLLGPFYVLLQAGASYYDRVEVDHPFAFGQYLLFNRNFYENIGGHAAVRDQLSEDTALARLAIQSGGYKFIPEPRVYTVQMFNTFSSFVQGWLRLLRLGIKEFKDGTALLTLLPLLALNIVNLSQLTVPAYIPVLMTLACIAFVQKRLGNFSWIGVVLFPLSIILFVLIACASVITKFLAMPFWWRGRRYEVHN